NCGATASNVKHAAEVATNAINRVTDALMKGALTGENLDGKRLVETSQRESRRRKPTGGRRHPAQDLDALASVVRVRSAPAGQIDRIVALGEFERLLHRPAEVVFHRLALDVAAQEVGPEEFGKRRGVLGKAAGAPQLAGEATERIVLQVFNRLRQIA